MTVQTAAELFTGPALLSGKDLTTGARTCIFVFFLNFFPFGLIGITGLLAMSACYLIIPKTNQARDEKNDSLFNKLHTLSVALTMLVLFLNLSVFFILL